MSEQLQGMKDKAPETPNVPAETTPQQASEIPVAEQNRLRQEGRQLLETEMNDRVKQLTDQVSGKSILLILKCYRPIFKKYLIVVFKIFLGGYQSIFTEYC